MIALVRCRSIARSHWSGGGLSELHGRRGGEAARGSLGARGPGTVGRVDVIRLIALRAEPLSVDEARAAVASDGAGGIALFAGAVRDHDDGRPVTGMSYTAHPSAEGELRRVAEQIAGKFEVHGLAAVHRVGDLEIGDLAVVVAVSCAHRAEAISACHALIDELKASVPIWKHQRFGDGTSEWVGSP